MYYGLGQGDGYPIRPYGGAMILKRKVHKQLWHKKEIKGPKTEFFREKESNDPTITNLKEPGKINIKEPEKINKCSFKTIHIKFERNTKIKDIERLLDFGVLKLQVEGDNVYQWVHFDKIDDHNYKIDLREIPCLTDQLFVITYLVPDEEINPIIATISINAAMDKTIT